jgi:hypothetical protein
MGGTHYSHVDYMSKKSFKASTGTATFVHTSAISTGKAEARVHKDLSPYGVTLREARDSDAHPLSVPIAVVMDTTGSMRRVPEILEDRLSHLMGAFLEDKASGKKYLGEGYPAIMVGANDDYDAQSSYGGKDNGAFQVGQFESGIEIDNDLEKIWLTGNGGGTYSESYELALYFLARHTAHDHWDKRGKKGYAFIIGDEHAYPVVSKAQVEEIFGDKIQADIPLKDIIAEVQERYNLFFVLPNLAAHYEDKALHKYWLDLLDQQHFLLLREPEKICELIASTVAITEEYVGLDDLEADGVANEDIKKALVPLAGSKEVSKHSAAGLAPVAGGGGGTERL